MVDYTLPNYGLNNQSILAPGSMDPAQMGAVAPAAALPTASPTSTFPVASPANTLGTGLGMNVGTMGLAVSGLGTIGSLWNAWEANKLAKQQFAASKEFATANLENSMQAYNTTLSNQASARASYEGWTDKEARNYVKDNRLGKA